MAFPLGTPGYWIELTPTIAEYLLPGIPVYLVLELKLRLHRQSWRNVTLQDLERVALAVALGTGVSSGRPRTLPMVEHRLPRTVPLMPASSP